MSKSLKITTTSLFINPFHSMQFPLVHRLDSQFGSHSGHVCLLCRCTCINLRTVRECQSGGVSRAGSTACFNESYGLLNAGGVLGGACISHAGGQEDFVGGGKLPQECASPEARNIGSATGWIGNGPPGNCKEPHSGCRLPYHA